MQDLLLGHRAVQGEESPLLCCQRWQGCSAGGRRLPGGLQPAKLSSTGTAKLAGAEVRGKFVQSAVKATWS